MKTIRIIDLFKPLLIIEYLLERESRENYIIDFAQQVGIKVDEDGALNQYEYIYAHDYFGDEDDFCFANQCFLDIKELEKFIADAKKRGATHLDIHHHTDHGNYNMYALKFRLGSDKDKAKIAKLREKKFPQVVKYFDDQINELQKQKEKIVNELNKNKGNFK